MKLTQILMLATAALAVAACGQKSSETTTISGIAPDATEVHVMINDLQLDTVVAVNDGKFSVEIPKCLTALAFIEAGDCSAQFISDGTGLNFDLSGEDAVLKSGGKNSINSRLEAFNNWNRDFISDYRSQLAEIVNDENLSEDEKTAKAGELSDKASETYNVFNMKVVDENKDNFLGVMALQNVYSEYEAEKLTKVLEGFAPALQENRFVKSIKEALASRAKTAEGMMFTDFEVEETPGKVSKLSDYVGKGKYVLVDFWASWCGPCRGEMPNLKSVYEKYHGDSFDMLSVAVWDDPAETAEAAAELGISWNQIVNAQKIPTDLYGIEGIPHIILFGPDGTILKRDLRGSAIGEEIAKYVK
ncbi:MAG: TlpA family protein disulfide reductase [Bacteroidales bacterium]|nr:TlpA family protein disulfide reductase [Bacteroidales bacterium]